MLSVSWTVKNNFGRDITISVEDQGNDDVILEKVIPFKRQLALTARVSQVYHVKQTSNDRSVDIGRVTHELNGTVLVIDWSKKYVNETEWRLDDQKNTSMNLARKIRREKDLALQYMLDIKQPAVLPVFSATGWYVEKAPRFVIRSLREFYKSAASNDSKFNKNRCRLIPLSNEIKTSLVPVLKVALERWLDQELLLQTTAPALRECKRASSYATHVTSLTADVIGLELIISCQKTGNAQSKWPLEVVGHDGIRRNVTLKDGDVIMFESASVPVGRPFKSQADNCVTLPLYFKPTTDWFWRISHDNKHFEFRNKRVEPLDDLGTKLSEKRAKKKYKRREEL